jgi:hypothetical protein
MTSTPRAFNSDVSKCLPEKCDEFTNPCEITAAKDMLSPIIVDSDPQLVEPRQSERLPTTAAESTVECRRNLVNGSLHSVSMQWSVISPEGPRLRLVYTTFLVVSISTMVAVWVRFTRLA